MHAYTVHEPPEPPVDRIDRAGSLTFIGDRFAPAAVAFGPLWLAANRLWHALALYLATLTVLAGKLPSIDSVRGATGEAVGTLERGWDQVGVEHDESLWFLKGDMMLQVVYRTAAIDAPKALRLATIALGRLSILR